MISVVTVLLWWFLWFGTPLLTAHCRLFIRKILVVLILCFASISLYHYIIYWYPHAHIRETTLVRVGPDISYGTSGTVMQDEEVVVYSMHQGWRKIRKNTVIGWVPKTALYEFNQEV